MAAIEEEPIEEDTMRSELEEIQMEMNAKTDESLESTRRMLALAEESQDTGAKTLVMLQGQGEQLDRINEGMDQINQDMKDAEKNLEGMEKCCGLCVLPWNKSKNFERGSAYDATWKATDDGPTNTNGPRMVVNDGGGPGQMGGYVTKITNDAREDEMEQNIQEVSGMVGNLRNMAVDMGNEIDTQNRLLDRVNQKATSNEVRIQEANKRANKLLKDA